MAVSAWELKRDLPSNFDAVRLALSVCVIYAHSITSLRGTKLKPEESDPICYLTRGSVHLGELAVGGFFMLSGLLIVHSWMSSKGNWDFLWKRVLRIYPAFLGVVLFCTFIVGPISRLSFLGFLNQLDVNLWLGSAVRLSLSLPPLFVENPQSGNANVSLWTIPYEFDCYLCILALGTAQLLKYRACILAIWLTVYGFHMAGSAEHWPHFLTYFLSGTVFYLYRAHIPRSKWHLWACLSTLALVALFAPAKLPAFIPICGTYVIFFIAFSKSALHNIRDKIGDVSYGMYLFAFPVQQLLVQYWRENLNPNTLFLAATAATFLLAALSWFLIEKPFLSIRQRKVNQESKGWLGVASATCMFVIVAFGSLALAHTLVGAKVGRIWQLVFQAHASMALIALADTFFVAWLVWGIAVLRNDVTAKPNWRTFIAQIPFWAWFVLISYQSMTSFARTLPGWLPASAVN